MKVKYVYLLLAVVGTVVPLKFFFDFLLLNPDPGLFFKQMFSTEVSAFFTTDLIISSMALITFILFDATKLKVPNPWVYVFFNLFVGVSLALPAYLYARENRKEAIKNKGSRKSSHSGIRLPEP